MACPNFTRPDVDQQFCLLENTIDFEESGLATYYDIKELTGLTHEMLPGTHQGLCRAKKFQMYCQNSLFGPVSFHRYDKVYFFVSIGNPGNLELPEAEPVD